MNTKLESYKVKLHYKTRKQLAKRIGGKTDARVANRCRILLSLNRGYSVEETAERVECSEATVKRIRKRFLVEGWEEAIKEKKRKGRPPKFTAKDEKELIALACTDPPDGAPRWTLRLLAKMFRKEISYGCVQRIISEDGLKPWREKMWCVPTLTPNYLERMFDVIDTYNRPYDPQLPVICIDEKHVELHGEHHKPLRRKRITLRDYEYIRKGTANIFVITEPKGGRHYAKVTRRRTRKDFAHCIKWVASLYPNAITIHLVLDNLNTHNEKSLTDTFGEIEGRRLWARFTIHYTPVHGSWLNQAEIAISVMQRCCLGKERIADIQTLRKRVTSFWKLRRKERWKINWRFTKEKAKHWLKTF